MIELKKNIYWLGTRDWASTSFHGHEMSTPHGTSYNSYVIKDKKTVLIDTCKVTKKEEYLHILENEVGFENIDLIISNHSEPDHSGSLFEVLKRAGKDTPVYCTQMGKKFISKFFGEDINFHVISTGDEISLGETTLRFIEMKMIHWPDSMMTYAIEQKVLFSNDAFGQHIASGKIFDDEVDECDLFYESLKYYVNILTPLSRLIKKRLEEIISMNIEIDLIAPSHGVMWRKNIDRIVSKYVKWANSVNNEKVVVIYDTMYGTSETMAKAIGKGLENENVEFGIYNASTHDMSDLLTEMFLSRGMIIGGPTINNSILSRLAGLLEELRSMKFTGKIGTSFGTYGWSGESCKIIKEGLIKSGIDIIIEPISVFLKASKEDIEICIKFGEDFARLMKQE